jgi:hypothetical protein
MIERENVKTSKLFHQVILEFMSATASKIIIILFSILTPLYRKV